MRWITGLVFLLIGVGAFWAVVSGLVPVTGRALSSAEFPKPSLEAVWTLGLDGWVTLAGGIGCVAAGAVLLGHPKSRTPTDPRRRNWGKVLAAGLFADTVVAAAFLALSVLAIQRGVSDRVAGTLFLGACVATTVGAVLVLVLAFLPKSRGAYGGLVAIFAVELVAVCGVCALGTDLV